MRCSEFSNPSENRCRYLRLMRERLQKTSFNRVGDKPDFHEHGRHLRSSDKEELSSDSPVACAKTTNKMTLDRCREQIALLPCRCMDQGFNPMRLWIVKSIAVYAHEQIRSDLISEQSALNRSDKPIIAASKDDLD